MPTPLPVTSPSRMQSGLRPGLLVAAFVVGATGGWQAPIVLAQTNTEAPVSLRVGKLSPGMVSLAGLKVVQEDLGINSTPAPDEDLSQGDLLKRLASAMNEDFQTELQAELDSQKANLDELDPAERRRLNSRVDRLRSKLNAAYLPKLQEVLTAAQVQRLRQVHWQLQGTSALQEPELIDQLKLSNQQINRIRTTIADAQTRANNVANSPFAGGGIERGGYGEMQRRIANIESERDRQVNDLLTAEQRQAWAELLGKPFDRRRLTTAATAPKQTERTKPQVKTRQPKAEAPTDDQTGATLGDRPKTAPPAKNN